MKKLNSYNKGIQAESYINTIYQQKGFCNLYTRYKTKYGEIDLIFLKDEMLVFTEVKYRKNFLSIEYSLSEKQKMRIYNTALFFIQEHYPKFDNYQLRFDVAFSSPDNNAHIIENIFYDV